jgi:hypothetical protein
MKSRLLSGILVAMTRIVVVCCVLASASAMADPGGSHRCSNRTLSGDYGFIIEGTILGPNLSVRGLAMQHYDGMGNITQVDHLVTEGQPPATDWLEGTGTYNVNPDCTGEATINSASNPLPVVLHFVVVKKGTEIRQVVDANAVVAVGSKID